ncbi:hypothetical protein Pmar_PMAR021842, partial [Perkinsus marinus ATCC 50983]
VNESTSSVSPANAHASTGYSNSCGPGTPTLLRRAAVPQSLVSDLEDTQRICEHQLAVKRELHLKDHKVAINVPVLPVISRSIHSPAR